MVLNEKKIAIITAMKEEAEHIIHEYKLIEKKSIGNIYIYENNYIVLFLSGIWKIQSSLATTYLCLNYNFEKLINIGIAWSLLWKNACIGDVFLVSKIIQHDVYLPFDGEHLNYIKNPININNTSIEIHDKNFDFWVIYDACCLTWDQFISDEDIIENLRKLYMGHIVEMEAFAVASVANNFDMLDKCIFIKAISDWANKSAINDHMNNLDLAMNNSIVVLKEVIW